MASHAEESTRRAGTAPAPRPEPGADANSSASVTAPDTRPPPLPEPFPSDLVALAAIAASLVGALVPASAPAGLVEIGRGVGWALVALLVSHGIVTLVALLRARAARSAVSPPHGGGSGRPLARAAVSWLQASLVGAVMLTWDGEVRTLLWLSLALVTIHLGWRIASVRLAGRDLPSLARIGATVLLGLGPALAALMLSSAAPVPDDVAGDVTPGRIVRPGGPGVTLRPNDIGATVRPGAARPGPGAPAGTARPSSAGRVLRPGGTGAVLRPNDIGTVVRPGATAIRGSGVPEDVTRPSDPESAARPVSAVATAGTVAAALGWVILGLATCLSFHRVRTTEVRTRRSIRALAWLRSLAIVGAVAALFVAVWTEGAQTSFDERSPFSISVALAGVAVLIGLVPAIASPRVRTGRSEPDGTEARADDGGDAPEGAIGLDATDGADLPKPIPPRRRNSRQKEARRKLKIARAAGAG